MKCLLAEYFLNRRYLWNFASNSNEQFHLPIDERRSDKIKKKAPSNVLSFYAITRDLINRFG